MGLAVSMGVLASDPDPDPEGVEWLRAAFQQVNRVLAAHRLPPHEEPERLPAIPYRGQLRGFPYSWLHYLRRAVAFARQAPEQFCPVAAGDDPSQDDRVDRELSVMMDSHLIRHSDCEGFYVPIDFPEPLYDDGDGLPGSILGSSQRALRETMQAAPLLGIPLTAEKLSDEAARAIVQEPDGAHPYWIERKVWLTMRRCRGKGARKPRLRLTPPATPALQPHNTTTRAATACDANSDLALAEGEGENDARGHRRAGRGGGCSSCTLV